MISPPVAVNADVYEMIGRNAVMAVGVSGGKDSDACAIAVCNFLDQMGHKGPRVFVHADLGVVEWKDSLPSCERLAQHLGVELLTVRRQAGDMMDRWEGRWSNNVERYTDLSCVKLILPWSTPSMRFCTSELKTAVIASELRKRYPNEPIVNVTGIRRQESTNRAKMPVTAPHAKLQRKHADGLTWNAIIEWTIDEVFAAIEASGKRLHEAYTKYNSSRVSCAFCIMSTAKDLLSAARCHDNQDLYRRMVELEVRSTFAFQGGTWLADIAPNLLSIKTIALAQQAKERAHLREIAEARIPKQMLYCNGWPTGIPTLQEAEILANVRIEVSKVVGIAVNYVSPDTILARYDQLLIEAHEAEIRSKGRVRKTIPIQIQNEFAFC